MCCAKNRRVGQCLRSGGVVVIGLSFCIGMVRDSVCITRFWSGAAFLGQTPKVAESMICIGRYNSSPCELPLLNFFDMHVG